LVQKKAFKTGVQNGYKFNLQEIIDERRQYSADGSVTKSRKERENCDIRTLVRFRINI
jgi:hypothetical protein